MAALGLAAFPNLRFAESRLIDSRALIFSLSNSFRFVCRSTSSGLSGREVNRPTQFHEGLGFKSLRKVDFQSGYNYGVSRIG